MEQFTTFRAYTIALVWRYVYMVVPPQLPWCLRRCVRNKPPPLTGPTRRKITQGAGLVAPVDGIYVSHSVLLPTTDESALPQATDRIAFTCLPVSREANAPPISRYPPIDIGGSTYTLPDLLGFPAPPPRCGHELHALLFRIPFGKEQRFFAPCNIALTQFVHVPGSVPSADASHWTSDRLSMAGRWEGGFFAVVGVASGSLDGTVHATPTLLCSELDSGITQMQTAGEGASSNDAASKVQTAGQDSRSDSSAAPEFGPADPEDYIRRRFNSFTNKAAAATAPAAPQGSWLAHAVKWGVRRAWSFVPMWRLQQWWAMFQLALRSTRFVRAWAAPHIDLVFAREPFGIAGLDAWVPVPTQGGAQAVASQAGQAGSETPYVSTGGSVLQPPAFLVQRATALTAGGGGRVRAPGDELGSFDVYHDAHVLILAEAPISPDHPDRVPVLNSKLLQLQQQVAAPQGVAARIAVVEKRVVTGQGLWV